MSSITYFDIFVSLFILCCLRNALETSGHGMLLDPINRSSVWRFEEFKSFNASENWADNELYCGGIDNQHLNNGGRCGVCGDNYSDPMPRANEDGGIFGQGIIVRTYKSGQVIPIQVNLTTSHWGWFEMKLCAEDEINSHLDESCYDKHLLEIISPSNKEIWIEKQKINNRGLKAGKDTSTKKPLSGKGTERITKFFVTIGISHPHDAPMKYDFMVRLPKGIRCKHCVLRWEYRTGTNWGVCEDGTEARGCGPQETFRNCADIEIR